MKNLPYASLLIAVENSEESPEFMYNASGGSSADDSTCQSGMEITPQYLQSPKSWLIVKGRKKSPPSRSKIFEIIDETKLIIMEDLPFNIFEINQKKPSSLCATYGSHHNRHYEIFAHFGIAEWNALEAKIWFSESRCRYLTWGNIPKLLRHNFVRWWRKRQLYACYTYSHFELKVYQLGLETFSLYGHPMMGTRLRMLVSNVT